MVTDPHYYAWLGFVVSWIIFPLISLQAFLRYRKEKKRLDAIIGVACMVLLAIRFFR